jgi:cell division septum initiation protein DivIVA
MASNVPESAIARAINRVLAAERDAADAIAAAQREADAIIEAARTERRRLLERARGRAARIHGASQLRLDRLLDRLEHGASAPGADLATLDQLAHQAVARLARRLTSTDHEPS